MTRDEAAQELANLRDRLVWDVDNKNETRRAKSALNAGIEAIVGKQPDAKTGLMLCGCGGKAQCCGNSGDYDSYSFECIKCETGTLSFNTKEEAKNVWNLAMGYSEADE